MFQLLLIATLAADPCAAGPIYQLGAYPCDATMQATPCRCGEFLALEYVNGLPDRVEIRRGTPGTQTWQIVGTLKKSPAYADDDGTHPEWLSPYWFPWKDATNPPADVTVEYCMRGCDLAGNCEAWKAAACVLYRRTASEYLCYSGGRKVPC